MSSNHDEANDAMKIALFKEVKENEHSIVQLGKKASLAILKSFDTALQQLKRFLFI